MIDHQTYPAEPWAVRETALDLDVLGQGESVFALANGHLGLRGNLDEGEPRALSGTYLNGFYESHPISYGERGFGFPEDGQTVVNVTDGKLIRLLVEDEALDVHRGRLHAHERVLDLRAGTLERSLRWSSEAGRAVRLRSRRLVSFVDRGVAGISYESRPSRSRCGWRCSRTGSPTGRTAPATAIRAPARASARRCRAGCRSTTASGWCSRTPRAAAGWRSCRHGARDRCRRHAADARRERARPRACHDLGGAGSRPAAAPGEAAGLPPELPVTRSIPPAPRLSVPAQPAGRAPARRRARAG